jgi:fatty acid desaturase
MSEVASGTADLAHAQAIPSPKQQQLPVAASLTKALLLLILLVASCAVAQGIADKLALAAPLSALWLLKWSLIGVCGVINVMLLIGMGILAHEAVHRVLLPSPFWNDLVGGLLSALALLPFYSNRQFHLTHHRYAHQPGLDPENTMHQRHILVAMTWGSIVALLLQLRILFANMLRMNEPRYAGRVIKDVLLMSSAGAFYLLLLPAIGISPLVSIVPVLALFPPVFGVRAMSDHYGIAAVKRASQQRADVLETDADAGVSERERRQKEVSGWVVLTSPWLEWLWSNVNYHEVHHKYPWLSYRYLSGAFAATRDKHNYLVVDGYWRSLWQLSKRPYYPEANEAGSDAQ